MEVDAVAVLVGGGEALRIEVVAILIHRWVHPVALCPPDGWCF
jgi:hypothetical protein